LDLRAVTIGHSNDTQNLDYLKSIATRGANIGLGRFVATTEDYVAQCAGIALALAQDAHADHTSLGHDGIFAGLWGRWRDEPNPDIWMFVLNHQIP
jgi:phosphotriesterase-related protein